ncbi:AAA-domain-containing protein [Xylaria intraflava]|nr:AAA-domain-containing protein [Xylaria intraflava]
MSNKWLCAFRSVAQNPRQRCLVSRPPTRFFHTTGPVRSTSDNGNEPPDSGRKPANEASSSEAEATEENPVGESATAANGETHGRKRPANSLRLRASRNRKSDLPPVQIPKSFLNLAIDRHGDLSTHLKVESAEENGQDNTAPDSPVDDILNLQRFEIRNGAFLRGAAWSESTVEGTIAALKLVSDVSAVWKRTEIFGVAAYWAVLYHVRRLFGEEAYSNILRSTPLPQSLDSVTTLLKCATAAPDNLFVFKPEFIELLLEQVTGGLEIPLTKAALFEPCIIDELVTSISAELLIRAPQNSKLANLRRPATVINMQDCSGFSVAQDIVQHVAQKLGADVLHLHSHDIAQIVGQYVGQDVTRSPGDISLLGFKTAEICGRLKSRPVDEENEDGEPYEVTYEDMSRDEKGQKDTKRYTISIDDFLLNSGTRGKGDERWEDLKVNTALEELIGSADMDVAEPRPLIIHINDFNALTMDETGAALLGKIRKTVDELWLSGRKIVLVGSCSTNNAPKAYQTAVKNLETIERVVCLTRRHFRGTQTRTACRSMLALWEKQDILRENDENIVRMLWSMTESSGSVPRQSVTTLGMSLYAVNQSTLSIFDKPFAKYWSSVLPLTEVYRVATTMIGLSATNGIQLFNRHCFEVAAEKMAAVDAVKEKAAASLKSAQSSRGNNKGDDYSGSRKPDPSSENHEERLLSGLINAQDIRTTFKDIHAPQETIESIKMLTTLSLVRPEAFLYGVLASDRIPGCLLYGAPGTGKTLLARAVAKESGANMIEISGASINDMYVGESEKNVRALFRLAKKKEPLVIFIDEADALLGARSGHQTAAKRETINQFLREWDGMDKTKAFIMVATNRPFDLDEAVLRRLPRRLLIDLPLEADRAAILRIHLKDEIVDDTVSIENLAKLTPLYSGSDLKNVVVAAAMAAVKEELEASERHTGPEPYKWVEKRVLSRRHFDKALKEISASVSEDMATLSAIRKFDERYGDSKSRKKRKGMGFEVVPEAPDSDEARVRSGRQN